MLKPRTAALFEDYASSHTHPTNRLTHKIAIPLIVFHIVAMLDWVRLVTVPGTNVGVTLGAVAYAAAAVWYLLADVKLGALTVLFMALCFPLGWVTPRWAVVAIAAVGWLIQLAGHVVWEKKQPSFFTNLVHALVGPLFFIAVMLRAWPAQQASMSQRA